MLLTEATATGSHSPVFLFQRVPLGHLFFFSVGIAVAVVPRVATARFAKEGTISVLTETATATGSHSPVFLFRRVPLGEPWFPAFINIYKNNIVMASVASHNRKEGS